MTRPEANKPEETKPEGDPFDIELRGVEREIYDDGEEFFDVSFTCIRANESLDAEITIPTKAVTTLDLIPRAMGLLHAAFALLAEQTKAWARKA